MRHANQTRARTQKRVVRHKRYNAQRTWQTIERIIFSSSKILISGTRLSIFLLPAEGTVPQHFSSFSLLPSIIIERFSRRGNPNERTKIKGKIKTQPKCVKMHACAKCVCACVWCAQPFSFFFFSFRRSFSSSSRNVKNRGRRRTNVTRGKRQRQPHNKQQTAKMQKAKMIIKPQPNEVNRGVVVW